VAPPDPWDAALSALHNHVDNLGVWLAVWQARTEPDARARRCASDAVAAVDAALIELHRIRARLIGETRAADDQAAARVDELLGTGLAPPGRECGGGPHSSTSRLPETPHPPGREDLSSSLAPGGVNPEPR
jgi:hypothetical protein